MTWLADLFGMDPKTEREVAESIGEVRSFTEYASDLAEAVGKSEFLPALRSVAPGWATAVGQSAGESLPLAKFALKLAEKLPDKPGAKQLGILACTLALERAASQALMVQGPPANRVPMIDSIKEAKAKVKKLRVDDPEILRGFSLDQPAAHFFVWQALDALRLPFAALGYSEAEIRSVGAGIRQDFKTELKDVLSEPASKEKFAPFVQWTQMGAEEDRAYYALQTRMAQQREEFHFRPVMGSEPFTLSEVYVETDCGELEWKIIRGDGKTAPVDAFQEKHGGRRTIISAVLDYMGRAKFRDAVVIQGGPGAGKSCFTLRLSDQLAKEGLCPLRFRIRDLHRMDLPLLDALSAAITDPEELTAEPSRVPKPSHALMEGKIFDEDVTFGDARISRYVLILDGWDEVSTAEKDYQSQVHDLLQRVRTEVLPHQSAGAGDPNRPSVGCGCSQSLPAGRHADSHSPAVHAQTA